MSTIIGSPGRRAVVAGLGATLVAPLAAPNIIPSARAASNEPIRFAIVAAQSGPAGVADHTDYINGATQARLVHNGGGTWVDDGRHFRDMM